MRNKTKILHFATEFKAKSDDKSLTITGYASTTDIDRAGDVIVAEAWTKGALKNFMKNPIMLFNHNYNAPIGKVTDISITDKGLKIEAKILKSIGTIAELIAEEILKAFSVSFTVKEAEYSNEDDTYYIKDLELYEISVVSIPCNQDAVFSVAKSFESEKDYKSFLQDFVKPETKELTLAKADSTPKSKVDDSGSTPKTKELNMDPEELKALLKSVADETAKAIAKDTSDKAVKLEAEKAAELAASEKLNIQVKSSAETLLKDIEQRFNTKNEDLSKVVAELKDELTSKSEEIQKMRENKYNFTDRSGSNGDWKKHFESEVIDAYVLGLATKKGFDTKMGKALIEKVNAYSGVAVPSADFEQIVSTSIERDIQNALVLAPLFRELPMKSATMILPIMPDSGYAEFISTGTTDATAPKGNLDQRSATYGDEAGIAMAERTVTTKKLISLSYLGNDTEEDAIMPVLGLIKEAMIRSHARSVEQSLLLGNSAQGVYTSGIYDGLTEMAIDASTNLNAGGSGYASSDVITAANLFTLRKAMGKYGLRPEDVVYIVSQDAYYNLLEDSEFQDVNLVGDVSTKVKGKIGSVYGSNIIVCDEFPAKAAAKYCAVAVNTRNFLIPRLRGMTFESQYEAANQRNVLVATQRLGFIDIIADAKAVACYQYKLT